MKRDDYCSGCSQKDTCRQVYEKLGKAEGANVAPRAIVAFLVPIGVFIGSLAGSQRLLSGRFEEKTLILISFLLAVCMTLLVVFIIRVIRSPFNKENCKKGDFHGGNSQ